MPFTSILLTISSLCLKDQFLFLTLSKPISETGTTRQQVYSPPPTSGLYAFTWTVQAAGKHVVNPINSNSQHGEINAALMQNEVMKGVILADTEKQYDMGSANGFVVLDTKARDRFRIAVTEWNGQGDIYSNNNNDRTSFSGFRVS